MAVDKLVDSTQLDSDLTSVANAIRAKSGGSSQLAFPAGFVSEIQAIPSGGGGNFTLIGTKTFSNVPEYTSTSAWETAMDTEIDIKSTDYAWGYVVITCDTEIESSTEWGMTIALWSRTYSNHGTVWRLGCGQEIGEATLSFAAMTHNPTGTTSYGVVIQDNMQTIKITRKANSSLPKMRAGNYTVKVYGMTAF